MLVGDPILGLLAGVIAVRVMLSMTRTVVVPVITLGFTLASAFAYSYFGKYCATPCVFMPVQALAASGCGCAACLLVVLLLYATSHLMFVVSKAVYCFY